MTPPTGPSTKEGAALAMQSTPGSAGTLDRSRAVLPPSGRAADLNRRTADPAIDPTDYVCAAPTPLITWYLDQEDAIEPEIYDILWNNLADLVPTYEALLLHEEGEGGPEYFGYNGEYTRVMLKTEKDIRRFWDIRSDDIQLLGLHGTMLTDTARVAAAYREIFGVPAAIAAQLAAEVREAVLASAVLDGGNHPFFSFNAFAFSTSDGSIPDKIVMGDGMLAGYEELGFGDVAPQAVYAHEFAHHIQYENEYFDDLDGTGASQAEMTRYTELMADAMSAYFLTHKRGLALNQKRVEEFLRAFFEIGDCAFSNPGHHGTPDQRMAAAQFGFDLADSAQKQGHILTAEQFYAAFVAAYPTLVAPDAP